MGTLGKNLSTHQQRRRAERWLQSVREPDPGQCRDDFSERQSSCLLKFTYSMKNFLPVSNIFKMIYWKEFYLAKEHIISTKKPLTSKFAKHLVSVQIIYNLQLFTTNQWLKSSARNGSRVQKYLLKGKLRLSAEYHL